ncbi:methyl-accepting chemotaxis protein [Massilia sp. GCM10020059]|uniref:Methyl-accepting chemotaxis protein n=1 Tax=Massilia agrisoli TaxID=2892444 RepID=A0ABS8IZD3_9BURK|nr:methyl-accepting chemotaxis protein [Massilia agrisoli]MCC6073351.1 methyl-accepting chemotaxis protein [Massilia agrisoli]
MGFAWKGLGPEEKQDGAVAVAGPDTEFGGEAAAPAPAPEPQPGAPDDASPLSIGGAIRRKRGAAPADEAIDNPLPFIGHLSLPRQLRILLMVFGAGILVTILALWRNAASNEVASAQTQIASDALMHSQRIGKAAPNAVQGNVDAFKQLEESRALLTRDLNLLSRGGSFAGNTIPAAPGSKNKALAAVRTKWVSSDNAAGTILKMKPELTSFDMTFKQLDVLSPELLALSDELLNQKVQGGGSARELAAIGRMMMLTQRMARSSGEFLTSGGIRSDTAFQLGRDTTTFRLIVDGFLDGSAQLQLAPIRDPGMREKVIQIKSKFDTYQGLVASVLEDLPKFAAAKAAEQSIFYENEEVRKLLTDLQSSFRSDQDSANAWLFLLLLSAVFTLATAGAISRVMLQDSRNRTRGADRRREEAEAMRLMAQAKEEEAKATNEQNQAAILRLMNELQEVADGDLTVHATVSEDITGAIADSVNYTVEELRGLVERVTATAEQVTTASGNAQEISTELLSATEQQSREIQDASNTVLKMASEINDVSRSANESAEVARQSVAAAQQGSTAVENAIKGMIDIREQIQETSKRIKRLGESSQEIGEITELISDITEQTNVLALNAAIQAASAGEAGRGFSVVAEEVQRLAERSGDAAKQIGALVRTIQTDTHDAVAAMEKSTQGVVEGARLSDAAGAALSDISRVSNRLAELIQGISFATELQATSANGVAHNMQHILSVTEHTQDGTQQTAESIRQLSALAQELKNSVTRFRIAA